MVPKSKGEIRPPPPPPCSKAPASKALGALLHRLGERGVHRPRREAVGGGGGDCRSTSSWAAMPLAISASPSPPQPTGHPLAGPSRGPSRQPASVLLLPQPGHAMPARRPKGDERQRECPPPPPLSRTLGPRHPRHPPLFVPVADPLRPCVPSPSRARGFSPWRRGGSRVTAANCVSNCN